jgi:hypothetical protein
LYSAASCGVSWIWAKTQAWQESVRINVIRKVHWASHRYEPSIDCTYL